MKTKHLLQFTITFIGTFLIVFAQKSYLTSAQSFETIIPNCAPCFSSTD